MDTDQFSDEIPAALSGERLDRAVSLIADVSRSQAADLISDGLVLVDETVVTKSSTRLAEHSIVQVTVPRVNSELEPESSVEFGIAYEDDHILVIDKPTGLVVHPGAGNNDGTLVNGLLYRYPEIREVGQEGRPGIIHRLDKETSGLLMVAKQEQAYETLSAALAARVIDRYYLALVEGEVENSFGAVDAPLARSARDYRKVVISAGGKPAKTNFERINQYEGMTLLQCKLETGRTHQIRVHMASIGHPVYGDSKYGSKFDLGDAFFLHAAKLAFDHPISGQRVEVTSELPPHLQAHLEGLENIG